VKFGRSFTTEDTEGTPVKLAKEPVGVLLTHNPETEGDIRSLLG
jgi:hypothetical protein